MDDHQYTDGRKKKPTPAKSANAIKSMFQGRRCFICNEPLKGNTCQLAKTSTKYTSTPFSKCLNDVMGESFEVIVGDSDKSCQRCAALIQQRDRLNQDLAGVNKALKGFLTRKYTLLSFANRHAMPTTPQAITQAIDPLASLERNTSKFVGQQSVLMRNDAADPQQTTVKKPCVLILGKVAPKLQNKPVIPINNPVELYQCVQCHHMTTDANELKSHSCINTELTTHKKATPDKRKAKSKAIKNSVPPSKFVSRVKQVFNCTLCNVNFPNKKELDTHHEEHLAQLTDFSKKDEHNIGQDYSCTSCCETFPSLESLTSHLTPSLKINSNHCGMCNSSFSSKEEFSGHVAALHQTEDGANSDIHLIMKLTYVCSCCQCELESYKEFNKHKEDHISQAKINKRISKPVSSGIEEMEHDYAMEVNAPSTSEPLQITSEKDKENNECENSTSGSKKSIYECGMCPVRAETVDKLMEHFKSHKSSKIICKYCQILLPSVNALSKHLQYHTKPGQGMECQICIPSVSLKSRDLLMKHMADLHRLKHQCNYCGEQFRFLRELLAHQNQHPESKRFGCPKCGARFLKISQLQKHVELQHRDLKCRLCSKVIKNPSKLRQHEARHRNEKFPCTKCERIFKTPSGLRNHMAVHTGEYKYRCDTCERGFMNRNIFIEHTNNHLENPKPLYKCDICNKNFFYQGSLWIHRKWHKTPYPYECKLCGKKLRHASVLQVHMRKHRGERPYKCPYCPLNFNSPSTFKRHLMLHTGEYAYKCDECNKGFTGKNKYQLHRHQVHGEAMPKKQTMNEQDYKVNVPVQTLQDSAVLDGHPAAYIVESVGNADASNDEDSMPRVVEVVIDEEQQAVSSITLLGDPSRWA